MNLKEAHRHDKSSLFSNNRFDFKLLFLNTINTSA